MSNAGKSAKRRARQLMWQAHPVRIFGPHIAVIVGFGYLLSLGGLEPSVVFWICLPLAVYFLGVVCMRRQRKVAELQAEAKRYRIGYRTERATARHLRRLAWRRIFRHEAWFVLHDRAIEGSNANIDHIVVGPNGVSVVDTKSRERQFQVEHTRSQINYDNRPVDVSTTAWEAETVLTSLNRKFGTGAVRTRSCWAIHSKRRLPFRFFPVEPLKGRFSVGLLPIADLASYVAKASHGTPGERLSNARVIEVAEYLDKKFPVAR